MRDPIRGARRAFAAVLMLTFLPATSPPARVEVADGTEFVRAVGETILSLLGNAGLGASARKEGLRAVYRAYFDRDAIAAQMLGRAWHQASPDQKQELGALLEEYLIGMLTAQLAEFAGAEWQVLMSDPDGDGVVVYSHLADPRRGKHLNIKWRLSKAGATFTIRDVFVENVSIGLHQRREFAALASEHGGTAEGLIRILRERIIKRDRQP